MKLTNKGTTKMNDEMREACMSEVELKFTTNGQERFTAPTKRPKGEIELKDWKLNTEFVMKVCNHNKELLCITPELELVFADDVHPKEAADVFAKYVTEIWQTKVSELQTKLDKAVEALEEIADQYESEHFGDSITDGKAVVLAQQTLLEIKEIKR